MIGYDWYHAPNAHWAHCSQQDALGPLRPLTIRGPETLQRLQAGSTAFEHAFGPECREFRSTCGRLLSFAGKFASKMMIVHDRSVPQMTKIASLLSNSSKWLTTHMNWGSS